MPKAFVRGRSYDTLSHWTSVEYLLSQNHSWAKWADEEEVWDLHWPEYRYYPVGEIQPLMIGYIHTHTWPIVVQCNIKLEEKQWNQVLRSKQPPGDTNIPPHTHHSLIRLIDWFKFLALFWLDSCFQGPTCISHNVPSYLPHFSHRPFSSSCFTCNFSCLNFRVITVGCILISVCVCVCVCQSWAFLRILGVWGTLRIWVSLKIGFFQSIIHVCIWVLIISSGFLQVSSPTNLSNLY